MQQDVPIVYQDGKEQIGSSISCTLEIPVKWMLAWLTQFKFKRVRVLLCPLNPFHVQYILLVCVQLLTKL